MLTTAGANGLLSLLVFPPIRSLFIALGLEEREVSFQARLANQAEKKKSRLFF
ncbi:MAG: hypothetical protein GY822_00245 [Deltaproteobacteria bacterium]|nr:hypothetical protein [Deltaproteobacteria bacterium]